LISALALPDAKRRKLGIERQARDLKRQRLRYVQAGSPLLHHQEARSGVVGCPDDGMDLMRFEVFGEFLLDCFSRLPDFLEVLAAGTATAGDGFCYRTALKRELLASIVHRKRT